MRPEVTRYLVGAAAMSAMIALVPARTETAAQLRVVRLRNSFIEQFKNRATVSGLKFRIGRVKQAVNTIGAGGEDGDLHMSGRPGSEVALPMVAEIVNAGLKLKGGGLSDPQKAVALAKPLKANTEVTMSGVWRLWFEHPPSVTLVQGQTVPLPTTTNPDHIFEIHPVTEFNGQSTVASFVPIPGYTAYAAAKAFGAYEKLQFRVNKGSAFTTVASTKAGYNYTEFDAVLAGNAIDMNDGVFVLANILDKKGGKSVVASPRRLVFAKDTPAARVFVAGNHKKGAAWRLLGIPRVNLDKLMADAEEHRGEDVSVRGTYEMIVVGVIQ